MSQQLLPLKSDVSSDPDDELVVNVAEESATSVIDALAAETSQELFQELCKEPMTASELASVVDTSIQNVSYHLQKFETVGLIRQVDTWYSSRGKEMPVYAATSNSIVIKYSGDE